MAQSTTLARIWPHCRREHQHHAKAKLSGIEHLLRPSSRKGGLGRGGWRLTVVGRTGQGPRSAEPDCVPGDGSTAFVFLWLRPSYVPWRLKTPQIEAITSSSLPFAKAFDMFA